MKYFTEKFTGHREAVRVHMKKLRWLATVAVGHGANFAMVEGFDFILYPSVMAYFGTLKGAAIMWLLSFLVCYGTILFYNWSKTDWLGIEAAKEVLDEEHSSFFLRAMSWANKKGKWAILIVLSIFTDPFICLIYMREGAHNYQKMTRLDWRIFWLSFVIANTWWTTVIFTGLTVGEWLLKIIMTLK